MKMIRKIVGTIILFLDRVFTPKSMVREPETQKRVDEATKSLKLYQYHACPFCVKVRRAMKRLNLDIELRDAKKGGLYRDELLKFGGKGRVPCLKIEEENGSETWMYESSDIVAYLEQRFQDAPSSKAA